MEQDQASPSTPPQQAAAPARAPQEGEYVHFWYTETCDDTPTDILRHVQDMFERFSRLPFGRHAYIRRRPEIYRYKSFAGGAVASVSMRVSVKVENVPDEAELLGFWPGEDTQ